MRETLQCAENRACQNLCQALGSLGVPTILGSTCNVPAMLNANTLLSRAPADTDPELVAALGDGLAETLQQQHSYQSSQESSQRRELIERHDNTFKARLNLWHAMLAAPRENRTFTAIEYRHYQSKISAANNARRETENDLPPETIFGAEAAFDRATLDQHGLVFDSQVIRLTNRLVSNAMDSQPTLLVGDTGTCKTQLAKFVGWLNNPDRQLLISGHGDMMSGEFMGQTEQNSKTGRFEHRHTGTLPEAMEEGLVAIIDEINLADPRTIMRLQEYLLARPGKMVSVQEGGRDTQLAPGYAVIATANEASASRYKFRSTFDPAFYDRFDVRQVHYPGIRKHMNPFLQDARELKRLSYAAAADTDGLLTPHIEKRELDTLARLAFVTQHLYSVNSSDLWFRSGMSEQHRKKLKDAGFPETAEQTTSDFLDNDPMMTTCITPRSLMSMIRRIAPGNKPLIFREEVDNLIHTLDQGGATTNQACAKAALKLLRTS